jgi:hypothetical protein
MRVSARWPVIERTLRALLRERNSLKPVREKGGEPAPPAEPGRRGSAAAFRAVVEERLGNLERQLDEVKTRVNGLLFLIAGTVAAQIIIRLLG